MNTMSILTGNITTDSIRTLYDLGAAYYDATKGVENEEFFDLFRELDEDGLPIRDSEMDFEALGQAVLDTGYPILGEFVETSTYRSGGHMVCNGFTWFKHAFDPDFWRAIESAFPVQAA